MKNNKTRFATKLLMAVALPLTVACDRQTAYNHFEHTSVNGWEKNDTLTFDVGALERGGNYREEVGLRINSLYPFQGLCLVIEQQKLPMGIVRSDTLNCSLLDDKGNVKGKGVGYYQYSFHLTDLSLNEGDSLHISIHHNMKREILPGIADVGIKLSTY